MILVALITGTALGFLVRIPLRAWISNTGADYIQPEQWTESVGYYGALLTTRAGTPAGVIGILIVIALIVLAVVGTARAEDFGSRFVSTVAWTMPVLVIIGAIVLGTHAARYLQPLAFAPVLALVAATRSWRAPFRVQSVVAATVSALLLIGGALSVPRLVGASASPDPDLTCVTDWVNASGRTSAGQFWTVRLPKLHVEDPARLVQVDHELNGYAWLVNREDFEAREVSFLVEDAQTVEWRLPTSEIPDEVIGCGRYRIIDFGDATVPLGPQHS